MLFRSNDDFGSKQMIKVCKYHDLSSMLIAESTGKELRFEPFMGDSSFIDFSYIENANGSEEIKAIIGIASIGGDDNKSISKEDKGDLVKFDKDAIMRIERL